ncbi:MAG: phage baseplate assembly protein V [Nitrosomonadales bacterium]|nr:phage baseplate assembly protein V [Nitrosomonadales bacterium]
MRGHFGILPRMDIASLSRMIENLIRFGTVTEVDHAARHVRVTTGAITTGWLKWRAERAGRTVTWDPPSIGEQVMILSPSGELANGIVIPSIYSDEHDAPDDSPSTHVTRYPDGAVVSYNHESGALSVTGIKSAYVEVNGPASVKCTGHASVQADSGITLDGAGAGQTKGIVQGDCLCAFTGQPHGQVSATVAGSV